MSLTKFIGLTAAGCLLWNAILVYLGWYLGSNWTQVAGVSRYILLAAVALVVIVIVGYLFFRRRKTQEQKRLKDEIGQIGA